jgi:hypothetical protein
MIVSIHEAEVITIPSEPIQYFLKYFRKLMSVLFIKINRLAIVTSGIDVVERSWEFNT